VSPACQAPPGTCRAVISGFLESGWGGGGGGGSRKLGFQGDIESLAPMGQGGFGGPGALLLLQPGAGRTR
jgi:hypothetical protein